MPRTIDLTGRVFGKLRILHYVGSKPVGQKKRRFYLAQCECGVQTEILGDSVRSGLCKSCGCLRKKHGADSPKWTGYGDISGMLWADISGQANKGKPGRNTYARRKGIEFSITIEQAWNLFLKQNRRCALSGVELTFGELRGRRISRTASLDRIDSTKGYVMGNIQWIHKTLNLMKQSLSQETFVEFCIQVADHQRGANVSQVSYCSWRCNIRDRKGCLGGKCRFAAQVSGPQYHSRQV
jgi:hypothetical protein